MLTRKEHIAKIIRIITIPSLLVTVLLIILYFTRFDIFKNNANFFITVIFLGIIPTLGYPLQYALPRFKDKGRAGQRTLAFIMNIIGYTTALLYGFMQNVSHNLLLIYMAYFISIVILTIFNKLFHIRASGHSCSITGPLILLIYFVGPWCILPSLLIYAAVVWSSIELRRHTVKDLIMGSLACIVAFGLSLILLSLRI